MNVSEYSIIQIIMNSIVEIVFENSENILTFPSLIPSKSKPSASEVL